MSHKIHLLEFNVKKKVYLPKLAYFYLFDRKDLQTSYFPFY